MGVAGASSGAPRQGVLRGWLTQAKARAGLAANGVGDAEEMHKLSAPASTSWWGEALLTSSGLSSPMIELAFMRIVLSYKRAVRPRRFDREVLELASNTSANLILKERYAPALKSMKVLVLSDPAYFMAPKHLRELGFDATAEPTVFFHRSMTFGFGVCGGFELPSENITHVTLWDKPWLFTGGTCKFNGTDFLIPRAAEGVIAADVEEYLKLLKKVADRSQELDNPSLTTQHHHPQMLGQSAYGRHHSCSNATHGKQHTPLQLATELYRVSTKLDKKYQKLADAWVKAMVASHDVLAHNGGDVVLGNLSHQVNQRVSDGLAAAVRRGAIIWLSRSAGTMLCMKSIEMSKEVSEAKLRDLSCSASFAHRGGAGYSTSDLNGTGIHANVLGAVPLISCCLAMRPHFNAQAWSKEVAHGNEEAVLEFEHSQHTNNIDIKEVAQSGIHMKAAVDLANIVRRNKKQNHPIFLPMSDGEGLQCHFGPLGESFTACGHPRKQARGESTKYSMVLLAEAGVASMLSKLEDLTDEDKGSKILGAERDYGSEQPQQSHGFVHRLETTAQRVSGHFGRGNVKV